MKHTITASIALLILFLLASLAVPNAFAQERIAREALYNSPDGFHVFIPQGWENLSTGAYAHFSHPEADVDIYAASAPTEDVQAGIEQVIGLILPNFSGDSSQVSDVILSNGTWTQNVYSPSVEATLTAYGQVYEGDTYVVLWYSAQAVQPVIVPGEDVQAGITAGLEMLGHELEAPTTTEEITINEQVWNRNVYDGTPSITALGRVRGETTLVLVLPAATTESDVDSLTFFSLLTDFFITPATTPYLYLGLAAAGIIVILFLGSMAIRYRNLRKDLETLETLDTEG